MSKSWKASKSKKIAHPVRMLEENGTESSDVRGRERRLHDPALSTVIVA